MTNEFWHAPKDDTGREWLISYKNAGIEYKGILPQELLDDEVGDESSYEERVAWIKKNHSMILHALQAKVDGGFIRKPFDRIIATED